VIHVNCSMRSGFLGSSVGPINLENLRNNAMQDIGGLFPQAQVVRQTRAQQIRIAASGLSGSRVLSPDMPLVELDIVDIALNYPRFPLTGRGLYDSENGRIFLCQGKWCRETLIHETLHSVSFWASRIDMRRRYLNLFEGLTEFFTGYIMFCSHQDCYQAWREERYQKCSVTYYSIGKALGCLLQIHSDSRAFESVFLEYNE